MTPGASLPDELARSVEALGRTITAQLREELAAAGSRRAALVAEFQRRHADYRTWLRMREVPDRVRAIAARLVRGEPAPVIRSALDLAVLEALSDAHGQALRESEAGLTGARNTSP